MNTTTPPKPRTTTELRLARARWALRLKRRRNHLDRIAKQRTSRTPRTRLTPERKLQLLKAWTEKVKQAERIVQRLDLELHARRTQTLGDRAWLHAGLLLHVREQGGNNRGPDVERIIRANGGVPGEAWCGDFNAACYLAAGSRTVVRSWAAVRYLGFLTGQVILRSIRRGRRGDMVVFKFDHTGLLGWYCLANGLRTDPATATHIVTREGNTGPSGAASDSVAGGDGVHQRIRPIEQVERVVRVKR